MHILIYNISNIDLCSSLLDMDNSNVYYSCDTRLNKTLQYSGSINNTKFDIIITSDISILPLTQYVIYIGDNICMTDTVFKASDINDFPIIYSKILSSLIKNTPRYKIAYVSPLLPDKTGIGAYSEDMICGLKSHFAINVYTETKKNDVFNLKQLYKTHQNYDIIIYNMGNNAEFHKNIYIMATRIPGIVILHDYELNGLLGSFLNINDMKYYNKNVYLSQINDSKYSEMFNGMNPYKHPLTFPLNDCFALITHVPFVYKKIISEYSQHDNIFLMPMGHHDGEVILSKNEKNNMIKFGVFGHMTHTKRVEQILHGFCKALKQNTNIYLYLVGKQYPYHISKLRDLQTIVNELNIHTYVTIYDFVDSQKFNQLINELDIAIGLRYPSVGESSGTIIKFLYNGKPCIISDVDQFKDVSDTCTIKIPIDDMEIDALCSAILKLSNNETLRKSMSKSAKLYAQINHSPQNMIYSMVDIINKVINNKKQIQYISLNGDDLKNLKLIDLMSSYNTDIVNKTIGISAVNIYRYIQNLPEYKQYDEKLSITLQINKLYIEYVGRHAETNELNKVYVDIKNGLTIPLLKYWMMQSDEHKSYRQQYTLKNDLTSKINTVFMNTLSRPVDFEALKYYEKLCNQDNGISIMMNEIYSSDEYKLNKQVYLVYWDVLHRLPTKDELIKWIGLKQSPELTKTNECDILQNIKNKIRNVTVKPCSTLLKDLKIKYISPLGTTGYCIAAMDYVYTLYLYGAQITYDYSYTEKLILQDDNEKFNVQLSLLNKNIDYDIVIFHSMPEHWAGLMKLEHYRNPKVRIYGLFAWETDTLPDFWKPHFDSVDHIIVPSNYVKSSVIKSFPNKKIHVIHHVIEPYTDLPLSNTSDASNIFTFLIVSQWNSRKCVEDTIRCYLSTFDRDDDVVLYVKTFVNDNPHDNMKLQKYINRIVDEYGQNKARVCVDIRTISDKEMMSIYNMSDCFISLSHSEGVGLGACMMAKLGKLVIMTGLGGHTEYIKNGFFVDYKLVNVKPCSDTDKLFNDHKSCTKYKCEYNPYFDGTIMRWADANMDHFKMLLKSVYNNRESYDVLKKDNIKYMKSHFSIESIANEFNIVLLC